MKKRTMLFVVCVILSIFFIAPSIQAMEGNKLVEAMREFDKSAIGDQNASMVSASFFMGYVRGVYETTSYLYGSGTQGATVGQICSIVSKYLKEHPEKWNQSASDLIIAALLEVFPKKKY